MELNNESKTLFIPLYGKAISSKNKQFLNDPKAEEIIERINYDFNTLKQSKWLSMFMSLRASLIDELCSKYIENNPNLTIIHLGCGLDSRCLRVNQKYNKWYDIDYENVIDIRKQFYNDTNTYKMISSSVNDYQWIEKIKDPENVLVILEGLIMYLSEKEVKELIIQINKRFNKVRFIFDSYTKKGVKLSKIKNPVNQMNAKIKYGINSANDFLTLNPNLEYVSTHLIRKEKNSLSGLTKMIFKKLYCGKISQSLYKIYEFNLKKDFLC